MSNQRSNNGRPVARIILVTILAGWALISALPSLSVLAYPLGTFGFTTDFDGHVTSVIPEGPADRAGLRFGDRIDPGRTDFKYRRYLDQYPGGYSFVAADGSATFAVARGTQLRTITLLPVPLVLSVGNKAIVVLRDLAAIVFVVVAAALVFLRPSPMTWGFFLYALAVNPGSSSTFYAILPAKLFVVQRVAFNMIVAAGFAGFLWFALRFPRDQLAGWRAAIDRFMPVLFVFLIARAAYAAIATLVLGQPSQTLVVIGWAASLILYLIGLAAFAATYVRSRGEDRQRIKWVIAGFAIGMPAFAFAYTFGGTSLLPEHDYWLYGLLELTNVLVPITVAYAVIRHRVIDVNFFVSRALVYTVLTAAIVAVFSILSYALGAAFASARFAQIIEIGIAVVLGFWLDAIERRVDRIIDAIFFRRRRAAELRLRRVGAALQFAQSEDIIDDLVIGEPAEALELASAAVFRRTGNGRLRRTSAIGWPPPALKEMTDDDPLVLQLLGEQGPMRVGELSWKHDDLPKGSARPLLAVPLLARHQLAGVALYGAHVAGQDIDADEEETLCALARNATEAYASLAAEALRRENDQLKSLLASERKTD